MCLALAVLWALLWFVKRRGGMSGMVFSSSPGMRIESRLALGPKKWILVARYQDRRLVLGVTEHSISLLTELYDEKDLANAAGADAQEAAGLSFASLLGQDKKPAQQGQAAPQLSLHQDQNP